MAWTARDISELQSKLLAAGYDIGPDGVDGRFGRNTEAAITKFQSDHGIPPTGRPDPKTISVLYPRPKPAKGLNIVQVKIMDYVLNFLTSKIAWASAAMVGIIVSWLSTKFGYNVPPDVQNWVTGILVTGFGALIMLLRTFFNSPKVATKAPEIVTKP